jgi:hypothetical protein
LSALSDALASGTLPAAHIGVLEAWHPAEPLWRVYSQIFGADGFNGTSKGFARFSPLKKADGSFVPTLYAGTTLDVALMEIVLRDVPNPSVGFQLMLPAPSAEQRRVTELVLAAPLRMVDFSAIGLRRIGLARADVIDCDSSNYPDTQTLGAWAYANTASFDPKKTVHGIVWTSRQDDSGQAAIFFGDRLPAGALTASNPGQSLHARHVEAALIHLAERLGIEVVVA